MHDPAKLVDALAAVVALGTLAQILPHVAALFTILWLAVRLWESDTVRGLTGRSLTGRRDED
jgi:hypothetical protein